MAGCVASTPTVQTVVDGAGTLRSDVILSGLTNNTVAYDATGVVKLPWHIRYGFGANGNFSVDDTFNTPLAIGPGGTSIYGPTIQAQYQSPRANTFVGIEVGWEVQAGYSDLNTFAGVSFDLQGSFDNAGWSNIQSFAHYQPAPCTVLWPCHAKLSLPADTVLRNIWFRMVVTAGVFGSGATVTAQFTRRRWVDVIY